MLFLLPLFLILGLFLPGFFLAKYLRHSLPWASAFAMSLLVLFHSIFWLGIFHVAITLWTVLPCLIVVSAGAAWMARRSAVPATMPVPAKPSTTSRKKPPPTARNPLWTTGDRILILSSGLVGGLLFVRCAITPLIGYDTRFRWDFLAQRLFALGRFDFYPPLTAADFRTYFYVDGIPPLVSFANWWLYASAGSYLPTLISVFVAAQFACTLAFTYGAATALFSRRAGVLAAATLAASPLYFKSVMLGQETGMTALAIAATIYFVVTARQPKDTAAMVSAGLAAALCALSREYGWIALVAGIVALLWRRQPLKQVCVFAAVAAAVAAPWYVRNWVLAGNPFYSMSLLHFAVNPIHVAILDYYKASLGFHRWTLHNWVSLGYFLLLSATPQILAGIPGAFRCFRRHGYLSVIALLLFAVWLQSVGYTSAGVGISTRVLSPLIVVLSITGAGVLELLTQRARWHTATMAAIILCQGFTMAHGVLFPANPNELNISQWPQRAFQRVPAPLEFEVNNELVRFLPPGSRVLSDNAFLHAALLDMGIEVVPVWSPEVRFLFSSSPEESERRLRELRIGSVVYYPKSLNSRYLDSSSPFYAAMQQRWHILVQIPGRMSIWVEKQP